MKENKVSVPDKPNKLQYRIDLVLTVLFIALIFFMGTMTVVKNHRGMRNSLVGRKRLVAYVKDPENYTEWDYFEARIRSLDNYLAANVYGASELGYVNSAFQYALGKRLINTGGSQMLTLNSGRLFDLQNKVSLDEAIQNINDMRATVPEGVPFLFVYEHPTIYEDNEIPAGYDVLDHSEELAQEIATRIRADGFNFIDSRDVLPYSGFAPSQYIMATDQHWASRAALIMAKRIAEELNALGKLGLNPELLAPEQFETEVLPKRFMGKYGQRIGTGLIDPDDITLFTPKYPTYIHRYTDYLGNITDIEGPFDVSVLRRQYLEPDEGKSYNIKAYFNYGLTENYDILTNPNGADCTILLLKDSYSAPIGSFLSLVANKVYSVDLRRTDLTLQQWIDRTKPDIVVLAYSMQMLRQDEYEFQ